MRVRSAAGARHRRRRAPCVALPRRDLERRSASGDARPRPRNRAARAHPRRADDRPRPRGPARLHGTGPRHRPPGTTIILITHHLEEIVPEIDRVVLLRAGRIVGDGAKPRCSSRSGCRASSISQSRSKGLTAIITPARSRRASADQTSPHLMRTRLSRRAIAVGIGRLDSGDVAQQAPPPPRQSPAAPGPRRVDFARQIQPILEARCLECHSQDAQGRAVARDLRRHARRREGRRRRPAGHGAPPAC